MWAQLDSLTRSDVLLTVQLNGLATTRCPRGTDGTQQVGFANVPDGIRAIVWEGSGSSAIDLHPGHFTNETGHQIYPMSLANGVAAGQQVGAGLRSGGGAPHAMLWQDTAESAINLHPSHLADVLSSSALATNGSVQVGWGSKELTGLQAFLWRGTPDSAVALHALLPEGLVGSVASSIDGEGRIYGVASGPAGYHAVMWTPIFVPEPSPFLCLGFCGIVIGWRCRFAQQAS